MSTELEDHKGAYLILGQSEVPGFAAIGRRYNLKTNRILISNTKEADIPISSSQNKTYMVWLIQDGEGWRFENQGDLGTTSLNGFLNTERSLQEGDLLRIGGTVFHFLEGSGIISGIYSEMSLATRIDLHTKAYNKEHFRSSLEDWVNLANRHRQPLSLIAMDIDHFKKVNDTHGHSVGDIVLKQFAQRVLNRTRKGDIFCRTGGEEFILILPETSKNNAIQLAEDIREDIAKEPIVYKENTLFITISLGVGEYEFQTTRDEFAERVDKLLYNAKHTGRNKVMS